MKIYKTTIATCAIGLMLTMVQIGCRPIPKKKEKTSAEQPSKPKEKTPLFMPNEQDDAENLGLVATAYALEEQDLLQQIRHTDLAKQLPFLSAKEREEARQQTLELDSLDTESNDLGLKAKQTPAQITAKKQELQAKAKERKEKIETRVASNRAKKAAAKNISNPEKAIKHLENLSKATTKLENQLKSNLKQSEIVEKKREQRLAKIEVLKEQIAKRISQLSNINSNSNKVVAEKNRKQTLIARTKARQKLVLARAEIRKTALVNKELESLGNGLNPHFRKYAHRDITPEELVYWRKKVVSGKWKVAEIKRFVRVAGKSGLLQNSEWSSSDESDLGFSQENTIDEADSQPSETLDAAVLEKDFSEPEPAPLEENTAPAPEPVATTNSPDSETEGFSDSYAPSSPSETTTTWSVRGNTENDGLFVT